MRGAPVSGLPGQSIDSIAVWRPLKLGDFLVAVPLLRALRGAFPKARIDYIGLPALYEAASRFPQYVSNFVPFPGLPGMPGQEWEPVAGVRFLREMQARSYDLLIQAQGNGRLSNPYASLCGARITAGFAGPYSYRPNKQWFMEYPQREHETLKLLRLAQFLGIPARSTRLEFPLEPEDEHALQSLPKTRRPSARYVCIHAGAYTARPWDARYFAQVADHCAAMGLQVVLTGVETERNITTRVKRYMREHAIDLTGRTSLGMLGALLKHARLYIGTDTGAALLSMALGTPSVTVFTTHSPARWGPLNAQHHVAFTADQATPKLVLTHAQRLLNRRSSPHGPPQSLYLAYSPSISPLSFTN